MIYIIKSITLLLFIFVGVSLRKGAGVGFDSWYAAPEALSRDLVTVLTLFSLAKIVLFIVSLFFKRK